MPVENRLAALIGKKQSELNRQIDITEVSQETGVSRETLYRWLRGDVTQVKFETIEKFCDYFNCDISDLLVMVKETS